MTLILGPQFVSAYFDPTVDDEDLTGTEIGPGMLAQCDDGVWRAEDGAQLVDRSPYDGPIEEPDDEDDGYLAEAKEEEERHEDGDLLLSRDEHALHIEELRAYHERKIRLIDDHPLEHAPTRIGSRKASSKNARRFTRQGWFSPHRDKSWKSQTSREGQHRQHQ